MSERRIRDLVKELKFDGYVECSALQGGDKLDDVFQTAVRLSLIKLGVVEDDTATNETEDRRKRCCVC